jgi:FtsZ-binding cell division protein ZapB
MERIRVEEADYLATLEDRILRAVDLVNTLRSENESLRREVEDSVAERDAARKEAVEAANRAATIEQELESLRSERKQVRTRIEKLLGQMDLLSNA